MEREKLFAYISSGKSLRWVAKKMRRSHTTLSRELERRSKYGRKYIPCYAQKEAERISSRQRQRSRLKNPLIFLYVRKHLRPPYSWSPEIISGRLSIDHPGESICHETIYRYIYLNKKTKSEKLWKYLALHRRKRMKKDGRKVKRYTHLSEAIPVPERPEHINNRSEPGHWETDNMEGKRSDKTSVSVTVERVTRKTKLGKLTDHTSKTKTNLVVEQLKGERIKVKSVTYDRGPENAGYKKISKELGAEAYACSPYHSWEKGTVENMIKRARKYSPKGESVDGVTQKHLNMVEDILNNTPRKCLNYLTPNEYYERICSASNT